MRYLILLLSGVKTTAQLAWYFTVGALNALTAHFASYGVDLPTAEKNYASAIAVFHASAITR